MYTATQAIEQTVKARIRELETGKRVDDCPLCEYSRSLVKSNYFWFCDGCPCTILHEDSCPQDDNCHHSDPEMGVSYALALQYYYDEYKKTGKTFKE
jgi:hypothetical protein